MAKTGSGTIKTAPSPQKSPNLQLGAAGAESPGRNRRTASLTAVAARNLAPSGATACSLGREPQVGRPPSSLSPRGATADTAPTTTTAVAPVSIDAVSGLPYDTPAKARIRRGGRDEESERLAGSRG